MRAAAVSQTKGNRISDIVRGLIDDTGISLGVLALQRGDSRDETMNSGTELVTRVAARLSLCHKSIRFSVAHRIWRFDDLILRVRAPIEWESLLPDGGSLLPCLVLNAVLRLGRRL